MSGSGPLPALDAAPLPGPPWLFTVLWVATFLVHLLAMNLVLGGSLLSSIALLLGRRVPGPAIARFFAEVNSWAISLTITFGIAPLLFLQVMGGRLFYAATVLVAPLWLGMLVLLTVAYYLNYLVKFRLRSGKGATAAVLLGSVLYLGITAIQVAVHLLHLQPARWQAANASAAAAFADPSFLPRFLHFVLAALTVAAVVLAWVAVRAEPPRPDGDAATRARLGVGIALGATILQVMDGFWLLLSIPRPVLKEMMKGGAAIHVPLDVSILCALAILVVLARVTDPMAQRRLVRHALELVGLAVILMTVTRHQMRGFYLKAAGVLDTPPVAPQWGTFALFLGAFVLCLGLTVYAVRRALRDRPGPGGEAA